MSEGFSAYHLPNGETQITNLSHKNPEDSVSYSIQDGDQTKHIVLYHPNNPDADIEMLIDVQPENYQFMTPIPPGRVELFKRQSDDQLILTIGHLPIPKYLPIDFSLDRRGRHSME